MGTTPTETGRAPFDTTARARKGDGSAAPESPRWAQLSAGWLSSADARHKMPVEHLSKIVIHELNGQT